MFHHSSTLLGHIFQISKKTLILLSIGIFCAAYAGETAQSTAHAREERPLILLLHSYAPDLAWTHDLNSSMINTFHELRPAFRVRSEFMDTKNFMTADHIQALRELYAQKYGKKQPYAVIVTDNNAMNFLQTYGRELFPNALTLATGINNAASPRARDYVKTVVSETINHVETLTQATRIWPSTQTVNIIVDETPTNAALLKEMLATSRILSKKFHVRILKGKTVEELESIVSRFDKTNLIYMFPFHLAAGGQRYKIKVVEGRIAAAAKVPVVTASINYVGSGALFSRGLQASGLGKQAAELMIAKISGKLVPHFLNGAPAQISLYDYSVVQRFNINPQLIPTDAHFLNRPQNFLKEHSDVILPAIGIIALLLILLVLQLINLRQQKRLTRYNADIIELNENVISTQCELLTTLGEVIEVRSQETGNHVRRVAKIARILGESTGMDEDELRLLEAAAPLHDIGKIGIPETILQKPGKLTPREFETVKGHALIGKKLLDGSDRKLLKMARTIAYQHHEKWDGTGYPQGLLATDIDLQARIVSLADAYDALTSPSCYKKTWAESDALTYIVSESGHSFDPDLVNIFVEHFEEIRALKKDYPPEENTVAVKPSDHPIPMYQI